MPKTTIYHNATVFTGVAARPLAEAFAVQNGRVLACGTEFAVRAAAGEQAAAVDLGGKFATPGIVEAHTHLGMLGEALDKVQLRDCRSLAEIQRRLQAARAERPDAPRVLGVSWTFDALDGAVRPTKEMLDAVIADVPVLLDANDLHSVWVNSAALEVLGIDRTTPNPVGGEIVRDEHGDATGFLLETAGVQYAWKYLAEAATEADHDRFLENALRVYMASGVTSATDMALNDELLGAIRRRLGRDRKLPFPITAHWLLTATGDTASDLAQVERVIGLRDEIADAHGTDWFRIAGVKFIVDGVIDACTAAMREPYVSGADPEPIWSYESALPVALAADRAGLALALHAIGDRASEIAVDLVAACVREHGPRADRRPRLEHLESVTDATIARMAALGISASLQPVHCDPAIMENWKAVLGDLRAETGFPWQKFRAAGVRIALGTDAPTAPHEAPHNLFIATTARSALNPALPPYHPERAFTPKDALEAMTFGAAQAAGLNGIGRIEPGFRANIAVFDVNPVADPAEDLLTATTALVLVDGEETYRAEA